MAQPTPLPPIILFGYDSSPFTQKIRLTLRLLQLPYTFVIVPSMMPRPVLADTFGLTYRKIPVLAIGRSVIVDTSLIVEWLVSHPTLSDYRARNGGGREIHEGPRERVLGRVLSSFFTDRPLFRVTTGLIPGVVWRTVFGGDRAGLIGHGLDAEKLAGKVPRNLAALDTLLSVVEPLFGGGKDGDGGGSGDGEWVLGVGLGRQDWERRGIENLTGGGTEDGFGEAMIGDVVCWDRYPGVMRWFERFQSYVESLPDLEKRVERGDEKGMEEVVRSVERSTRSEGVALLPTPNQRHQALEERIGWKLGSKVSLAPDDTGRGNPTIGKLVGVSPEEVVIIPDPPQVGGEERKKARIDGIRLHFPRLGFVVVPVKESKL